MNPVNTVSQAITELSFRDVLALLKRHQWIIWTFIIIGLAVAVAAGLILPKAFQAQRVLILEGRTQSNPGGANDIVGAITDSGIKLDVPTQIQVMENFEVVFTSLQRIGYPLPARLTEQNVQKLPRATVNQIQTTSSVLLSVEAQGDDGDSWAVKLTQMIPSVFEEKILETQKDQVKRSFEFITARIEEERSAMAKTEEDYAAYRGQNDIVDSRTEQDVRVGQLAQADRTLAEAESELDQARAALESIKRTKATLPAMIDNPLVITKGDTIVREEATLTSLEIQREALLVNNHPDSERIKRLDATIEAQRKNLERAKSDRSMDVSSKVQNPMVMEYIRAENGAVASVQAGEAKVERLRRIRDTWADKLKALPPISVKQREFETKLNESQTSILRLINIQNDIRLRDNALQSPVTDLTGTYPAKQVRPSWTVNLALGLILGALFGALVALVVDVGRDRVNTANEAMAIADAEILSRIPVRSAAREPIIANPQKARAFEAYRVLRSSLALAAGSSKALMVTSSLPREGKSTVAGNLAVAFALDGKRTILIDANLRKPVQHKFFKLPVERGLTDVLAGKVTLDEARKAGNVDNLTVITAGGDTANSTELVGSQAMKDLVAKATAEADIVIVDAPAAYGYADAQSLVNAVKDVVMVVQLEAPAKVQMRESVGMIEFAGGQIHGLVMNKDKVASQRAKRMG
ncbi:MAG: polysaccharide biosynthesis tyrosine autokinase [Fimbriimonadaceae bacterium]|nr:polysaccharide biosynthesis tyrosine autokinase [Fimbriimonadaceae bacterium]QYK57277.1 MAG: polysaccharide biosynthesis tyrosine autokinase [Fimbriimonadaceae bacterium]